MLIKDRQAVRMLATLTDNELSAFRKELKITGSPNENQLLKIFIKEDYTSLTQEILWEKAFGKQKPLNKEALSKDLHGLKRSLEVFFTKHALQYQAGLKPLLLVKEYLRRGLPKLFESALRDAHEELDEKPVLSPEDYYTKFVLAAEENKFLQFFPKKRKPHNLEALNQSLKRYMMLQTLIVVTTETANPRTAEKKNYRQFYKEFIDYVDRDAEFLTHSMPFLFWEIYKHHLGEAAHPIGTLVEFFIEKSPHIEDHTTKDVFDLFVNTYIKKKRAFPDKPEYTENLVELYHIGAEKQFMFKGGFLHHQHFKNAIAIFHLSGRIFEAELYFRKWEPFLNPGMQDEVSQLMASSIRISKAFREGVFSRSETQIKLLKEVIFLCDGSPFKSQVFRVQAQHLALKANYMLHFHEDPNNATWKKEQKGIRNRKRRILNEFPQKGKKRPPFFQARESWLVLFNHLLNRNSTEGLQQLLIEINQATPLDDKEWLVAATKARLGVLGISV